MKGWIENIPIWITDSCDMGKPSIKKKLSFGLWLKVRDIRKSRNTESDKFSSLFSLLLTVILAEKNISLLI